MTDYLADTTHLLVTGPTGARTNYGGKSSLTAWLADNPLRERELVIVLNVKQDDFADVLEDYEEVASVDELADAMADGHRRVIITPQTADWETVSANLEAFIRELPSDMTKAVILDEVPELDEDAVLRFTRLHGNGASCKTVALAQSPTDVSGSVVKNCVPVWIGPAPGSYDAWFRAHDLGEHIDTLHAQNPYEWSVLLGPDAADRDHFEPVSEVYIV